MCLRFFNNRQVRESMIMKIALLLLIANLGTAYGAGPHRDVVSEVAVFPSSLVNPSYIGPAHTEQSNLSVFAFTRVTFAQAGFGVEIQPELRAVQSDRALGPELRSSVRSPTRLMSLQTKLSSNIKSESTLDLERLNISYRSAGMQLSLGRRPVSLGVLNVFPVWNKFSRPLVTDYGPLRTFNQDQASVRMQRGEWLVQALDIEEQGARKSGATRVAQVSWFGDGVEVHAIGGEWWNSGALGLAAVTDVAGTSLKFEEISFSAEAMQMGLGLERAFSDTWSGVTEFMYLESGATDKRDYLLAPASRFRPLSARAYTFARVDYKPAPLWIIQFGDLLNLVDSSQLFNIKGLYSAGNDFELSGEVRLPTGSDDSELSRHVLPVQWILGARYDF